jgi:hypothetical protein
MLAQAVKLAGLLPAELGAQLRRHDRESFVAVNKDVPFLLVRVTNPDDALVPGLALCTSGGRLPPSPTPLSFMTAARTPESTARPRTQFTPVILRTLLGSAFFYAVPVRKRTDGGKAYAHRLSVGRASNNDVVLRDESISKFHAWFETEDEGAYFVTDARSKNTTRVNGRVLVAQHAERLRAGDRIHFGGIEVIFCPAETLWDAVCGA